MPETAELDQDQRVRAAIDRRQERVDQWWAQAVAKLVRKHRGEDFFDVPREERYALMRTYAEKSREAHGKEPVWGDPDSERMRELREEAGPAPKKPKPEKKSPAPKPRPKREVNPEAKIPCIDPECSQLAVTEPGMRKHIKFRHPEWTPEEVDEFFAP